MKNILDDGLTLAGDNLDQWYLYTG